MNYTFKSVKEFAEFIRIDSLLMRAERNRAERRARKLKVLTPHRAALALDALERIKRRKLLQSHSAITAHVLVEKPVIKRSAKGMGSKTMTLKVRNWQINARHFN